VSTPVYILSAALVLAAGFTVFRVIVRRDYAVRGHLSPVSALLEWVAILLWVGFGSANQSPDWPTVHVGSISRVIAWSLIVSGAGVMFTALFHTLGLRRSHGLDVERLERGSLYGLSRNPQVVGFLMALIGYLLLWPSSRNVGTMVLIAVIMHLMIRTEEEHLRERFGDEYERYRSTVPRYLAVPGLHRP
jgi:protein-S-isoprenylcysteine O-methyltransferase Ste14